MDKNYLLKITNELYRLTLLFPKKEPLRYKMRELADEILAKCSKCHFEQDPVLEDLEVLDSFFEVAKEQNWVSPQEILTLQKEYSKLKEDLGESESEVGNVEVRPQQNERGPTSINQRQQKILAILKEKGRAQVWEVKQIFSDVSKRTLRRDFENLFKRGVIERIGERNETFYQIKPK